jgi:hypothetical protein
METSQKLHESRADKEMQREKRRVLYLKTDKALSGYLHLHFRAVRVTVDLHGDELLADWELAIAGDEPFRIAPLQ